jgi:hypothetical protein
MKVSACLPPTHQAESQADLAKAQAVFEGASLKASEFPSDLARERGGRTALMLDFWSA